MKWIAVSVMVFCSSVCFGNEALKKQIEHLIRVQPETHDQFRRDHPEFEVGDSSVVDYLKVLRDDPARALRDGDEGINRAFRRSVGVYVLPNEYVWDREDLAAAPFILWPFPGSDFEAFPAEGYQYRVEWLALVRKRDVADLDAFICVSIYDCVDDLKAMAAEGFAPGGVLDAVKDMYSDEDWLNEVMRRGASKWSRSQYLDKSIMQYAHLVYAKNPSSFFELLPELDAISRRLGNVRLKSPGSPGEVNDSLAVVEQAGDRTEFENSARFYRDFLKVLGIDSNPDIEKLTEDEILQRIARINHVKKNISGVN